MSSNKIPILSYKSMLEKQTTSNIIKNTTLLTNTQHEVNNLSNKIVNLDIKETNNQSNNEFNNQPNNINQNISYINQYKPKYLYGIPYKKRKHKILRQRIIRPRYKSLYTKRETIKWLYHKIDYKFYHYDYCSKLFELLKKWTRINNFHININEDVLFGRFISLLYLMSNKQGY